jgi:5-methylcytosine-specific restriction endonuclease McrBC regulatory subunit McrC
MDFIRNGCLMALSSPSRTLTLVERKPRVVRLSPADVAHLLEHHRGRIAVLPEGKRDRFRLTALGWAGVLVLPHSRLVIRPKIPLTNVFALLDPLAPVPATIDSVEPQSGLEMFDFLAGLLARQMLERAATWLRRTYREQRECGPILRGRFDLQAQLRHAPGRKDQLHSFYDELSADNAVHRLEKATAEYVLASPLLGEDVRAALRSALAGYAEVSSLPLSERLWSTLNEESVLEEDRPLLDLCRLLTEGLIPANVAGSMAAPSFLLDLEKAFERHVTRGIVAAFADSQSHAVSVQMTRAVALPVEGQPALAVRPDLMIDCEGRTVLVIDAKWKRWAGSPETEDLYQVLSYGASLGAAEAVLVYPARRWRVREYRFLHSPLRLTVYTLPVGGTRAACLRSGQRLGRALRVSANTLR